MSSVKEVVIKAYTAADIEDTNYVIKLRPATGTNNASRVDLVIEQVMPSVILQVSINYAELMKGLSVVK